MIAKKCDRCGSFYEEIEPNAIEILGKTLLEFTQNQRKTPAPILHNDLCKRCSKSFSKWWGGASND